MRFKWRSLGMWRTYDLHRPKHRLISVLFPDPRNSIVLYPYQIPHGCIVVFNENALRALMYVSPHPSLHQFMHAVLFSLVLNHLTIPTTPVSQVDFKSQVPYMLTCIKSPTQHHLPRSLVVGTGAHSSCRETT